MYSNELYCAHHCSIYFRYESMSIKKEFFIPFMAFCSSIDRI